MAQPAEGGNMPSRSIIWPCCCALAAVFTAVLRNWAGVNDTGLPAPFFTRQPSFTIPFIPPTPGPGEQETAAVQLSVSTDRGATWTPADRVEPRKASFTFKPPHDGEYWFAFSAVDRQGHVKPDRPTAPALRVIADTLPPRLELKAVRRPSGEIAVDWLAVDPILKADTLTLEYQLAGESSWRAVEFQPPRDDPSRSTSVGDFAWQAAERGRTTVRATIRDRAGNVATAQASVEENSSTPEGPALEAPARSATPSVPPASPYNARPSEQRRDLTTRLDAPRDESNNRLAPPAHDPFAAASGQGSAAWPADRLSDHPLADSRAPSPAPPFDRGPSRVPASPVGNSNFSQPATPVTPGPVESRPNPPVADRVVAPAPPVDYARGMPPGEHPYMVNSRNFALEYEVESVGPSGVAKVEIWGTRDGGHSWQSFGIKPNEHGPVKVSVPEEGLYGFRITIEDGNGVSSKPPKSGDLPELWVGVDVTKPVAKFTAIDLGSGDHAGELLIRWEASDAMLAARPISLLFSERPEGPWSAIAAGLENIGFYSWRFDNRVPDNIYLRIDVRDEAGNIGQFQTAQPISLGSNRPQGHLRSVRPTDDATSRSSRLFWR
jgi:hypothetical protein